MKKNECASPSAGLRGGLYLVSTPIGNLRDITLRALDILNEADYILCEDTRVSQKLCQAHSIKAPLRTYNDHNGERKRPQILDDLQGGKVIALISDAGTPLISDPGYKLVRACHDQDIYVTSAPGANAPLTALQLSGLPTDSFMFMGFLPSKSTQRKKTLQPWEKSSVPLVVFESASRLPKTFKDCLEVFGDREAVIVREMTKKFEEVLEGRFSELLERIEKKPLKGEIVFIVKGYDGQETIADYEAMLKDALKTMRVKDAASYVAEKSNLPRKELYEKALKIQSEE